MAYAVPGTGTVLRASYGRTLETPYNENLLLSAGYGLNGLFGTSAAPPPGKRRELEVGGQQSIGRWIVADVGYFDKWTDNGYDFGVLFDTPIVFPISWNHSHVYGLTGRVNLLEHRGFSAFFVMATTNAIFSPPGTGGILLEQPARRLPDRSRSEVQRDHERAVRVQQAVRRVGVALVALRLGPGRRRGRESRGCACAQRGSTGGDRVLLRQSGRDAGRAADECELHRVELRCDSAEDPRRRHRGRREQPAAHRATAPVRPRDWRRQPPPHGEGQVARPVQRHQPDEQRSACTTSCRRSPARTSSRRGSTRSRRE